MLGKDHSFGMSSTRETDMQGQQSGGKKYESILGLKKQGNFQGGIEPKDNDLALSANGSRL